MPKSKPKAGGRSDILELEIRGRNRTFADDGSWASHRDFDALKPDHKGFDLVFSALSDHRHFEPGARK